MFRTLHDVIIRERGLEEIETSRGWPARSAKLLVSQLLYAIEETEGMFWGDTLEDAVRERTEYLTGADPDVRATDLMAALGLTAQEARFLLILKDANGRTLSKEALLRRLYADRGDGYPEENIIGVLTCKTRKKITGGRIETVWGQGIRWVPDRQDEGSAGAS